MRASADHYAETGQLEKAAQAYRELLAKVMASNPDPWNDLEDAYHLSSHYAALGAILGRAGLAAEAASFDARRWNCGSTGTRSFPITSLCFVRSL